VTRLPRHSTFNRNRRKSSESASSTSGGVSGNPVARGLADRHAPPARQLLGLFAHGLLRGFVKSVSADVPLQAEILNPEGDRVHEARGSEDEQADRDQEDGDPSGEVGVAGPCCCVSAARSALWDRAVLHQPEPADHESD
jgi:hypothetical protein